MKVISIEGIDGTGKTELLKGLERRLGQQDRCFVNFPTERFYERYIDLDKDMYRGLDYFKEVNLLQSDDKIHTYTYWKQRGKRIMFCDRYDVTQKVYDGSRLGEPTVELDTASDLVIYLDVDIETVLARINNRGIDDCLGYEEENTLRELKVRYERILEEEYSGRYKVISISPDDSIDDVLYMVIDYLSTIDLLVSEVQPYA